MKKLKVSGIVTVFLVSAACKSSINQSQLEPIKKNTIENKGGSFALTSSQTDFADWYQRHTEGERSASSSGTIRPAVAVSASAPTSASSSSPFCHNGEEAQPLSCALLPQPSASDIINKSAAIALGKALFWDIQVSSDGKTACASCHYQAGADTRTANTLHPGPDGVFASGKVTGPNQQFTASIITNDDRVGSQGIPNATFQNVSTSTNVAYDTCKWISAHPFGNSRAVTGRNSPTVIGAVFNVENFWDGRANSNFNGFDPFGDTANATKRMVLIKNASLASQAVGPVNNSVEMACAGRKFNGSNSVAAKLLSRPALQFQLVATSDSYLGGRSASPKNGLRCTNGSCTYQDLINAAFRPEIAKDALNNFSRIWGQAVMAYESILVPNQTPMDRFLTGTSSALTSSQKEGLKIFNGKAHCYECHSGPELSDASYTYLSREGSINLDGADQGFHNIGVRPTKEDLGRASIGPGGVSFARSNSSYNRGAFKTPMLRNIKLTAPYFHNGGIPNLSALVDFYARGGNFSNPEKSSEIKPFSLSSTEKSQLIDFLTNGITDCRVEKRRAPFDHPSLNVINGPSLSATGAEGIGSCP